MPAEPSRAVFLSYASQDAEAARRVCEVLRSGGVEVWLDADGGLDHGDEWDAKIRRQIKECVLFIPLISANTQARLEGYFRIEWDLAAERARGIASGVPFILPVVIDDTREPEALVPDRFRMLQWTRLPGGVMTPEVKARYLKLWSQRTGAATAAESAVARVSRPVNSDDSGQETPTTPSRRVPAAAWIAGVVVAGSIVALISSRRDEPPAAPSETGGKPPSAATARNPAVDPKSIAVLPFENLSAEPDAALFADGMHEEILTALGRVSAFKVIARASVQPYRDPAQRDLRRIAADLEIGSVIEGSVRRLGSRVRIAVKLIDAQSRRQLWADAFERDSADVFLIQAAVAQEVAAKLRAALTPGEQASLAQRPSSNARAYELYVEAKSLSATAGSKREVWDQVVAKLDEATRLDPQFAGAFAELSSTHSQMYFRTTVDSSPARVELARRALAAAQRLAPDHGQTALAAGDFAYCCEADYPKALRFYEIALRWNPSNAEVRNAMGVVLRRLGRHVEGAAELEKAFALNPTQVFQPYMQSLLMLRRYREFLAVNERIARTIDGELTAFRAVLARFELSGDREQLIKDRAARLEAASPGRALRLGREMGLLLARGDWEGALAWLSEARLAEIQDPVYFLTRARMAWLLGRRDLVQPACDRARALSDAAPAERFRALDQARVEVEIRALLGQAAEFRRAVEVLQRLSLEDRFVEPANTFLIATGHLILGDRAAALKGLESIMVGPNPASHGPHSIRIDPIWGKLTGDPRFEEILRNAKPL